MNEFQSEILGSEPLVPINGEQPNEKEDASGQIEVGPTWVIRTSKIGVGHKRAIGRFVATHYIHYGDGIMCGSGSTLNAFMDELIDFQLESNEPYDLKISSPNLQVIHKVRVAREKRVDLFLNTQVNLTGGQLQIALDSLLGQYAVLAITNDVFEPDIVLFGAAGVTFKNGFCIGYQFQEELSVQCALAARQTTHRVLMFDHNKLGRKGGWKADITPKLLLKETPKVTLVSTLPEDAKEKEVVQTEVEAFKLILRDLNEDPSFRDKEFELILIDKKSGDIRVHVSLSDVRRKGSQIDDHGRHNRKPNLPKPRELGAESIAVLR